MGLYIRVYNENGYTTLPHKWYDSVLKPGRHFRNFQAKEELWVRVPVRVVFVSLKPSAVHQEQSR